MIPKRSCSNGEQSDGLCDEDLGEQICCVRFASGSAMSRAVEEWLRDSRVAIPGGVSPTRAAARRRPTCWAAASTCISARSRLFCRSFVRESFAPSRSRAARAASSFPMCRPWPRQSTALKIGLPWINAEYDETCGLMGKDYWRSEEHTSELQ